MNIFRNIDLRKYCTFKIGGTCDFFCEVKSLDDLMYALNFAKDKSLKYYIIGSGSNILFLNNRFKGLIIKNSILGIKKISESKSKKVYAFGSGYLLDSVIKFTLRKKIYGMENLSGVPGTLGGAVVQNSGSCGVEIKDVVSAVEIFDVKTNKINIYKNKECIFDYRSSVFKQKTNHIIIKVYISLKKKFKPKLEHQELKDFFIKIRKITPSLIREKILKMRVDKIPDWRVEASAGSYFKNPIVHRTTLKRIKEKYPYVLVFPQRTDYFKISLGYILDKICNLKAYKHKDVEFYSKNALILVNHGKAKAEDVLYLANLAKKLVKKKVGIKIEEEVVCLK